jgi:hypothetical protein
MQAVLNVKSSEIDDKLLNVIKELLSRNVEIVIKKTVEFEDYDESKSLDDVMREFSAVGYNEEFLSDLKVGFETSPIYADRNEDKTVKGRDK